MENLQQAQTNKAKKVMLTTKALYAMKQMKKALKLVVIFQRGCFITAYAREETTVCQSIIDYSIRKYGKNLWCYTDTDSAHSCLTKEELQEFIHIDPVELGAWKVERRI